MSSFTKIFISLVVSFIALPLSISAQQANELTAVMVADVNVASHTITVSGNTISGNFFATSNMGNQDAVPYGFVMRSKETGALLDVSPVLGKLSLRQGEGVMTSVTYTAAPFSETAQVYLNLSNQQGVILATTLVGEIAASSDARICTVHADPDEGYVSCTADTDSKVSFTVYRGGPQGQAIDVARDSVALSASDETRIDFADILGNQPGGSYVISGSVSGGEAEERFAVDYLHEGKQAKIGSVVITHMGGMSYKAVVMTDIFGQSRSDFRLSITPSCGEKKDGIPVQSRVVEVPFDPTCASGTADIVLYDALSKGSKAADQVTTSFSIPPAPVSTGIGGFMDDFGLVALIAIMLAIVYKLLHHHHTSTPSGESMPPVTGSRKIAAVVVLFAALAYGSPTAEAATYSISSSAQINFCAGTAGAGCDVEGEYHTTGTVTIANSAVVGGTYTASVQSQSAVGGGAHFICRDTATDGSACDSLDVRTQFGQGSQLLYVGHASSGTVTFNSPSSAGTYTVTAIQSGWAPNYFGCDPTFSTKCTFGYYERVNANHSLSVTASAPPVVDIRFSFLEKMFSAFALNR